MAITKPTAITKPFSVNGDYVLPPESPDTFQANQDTGFPPSQSVILPAGTPVKRDELNGVFKLYSQFILWLTAGGQSTFEQSISDANGGYPKGVVLWCKSINGYLVSLIDNNTANFVTNPDYINDNVNWRSVNSITSDFNRSINLGTATTYTISLLDAFSLIYNDGISIAYTLPNYVTLPVGATFCIKNQLGTISNGIITITMTSANSNAYYKCEIGNNGWIIDGQPIATYSQWATQQYVESYVATNRYFSQLITSTGNWICPPNVTQIYVTLIGGGGSGAVSYNSNGGGGGGTGYLLFKKLVTVIPGTSYPITIGAGGIISDFAGNNGSPTIAFGLTANGGFGGFITGAGGAGGSTGASGGTGTVAPIGGGGGSIWIAGGGSGGYDGGGSAVSTGGGGGGCVIGFSGAGGNGAVLIEY